MPPTHHPSAQALANLLIGDCSPGAALLLARHIEACPQCAIRVQAMGAVGAAARDIQVDPPRSLRPGVEITHLKGVSGLGEAVFQLRVAPGEMLKLDEPLPLAELLVLEGVLCVDNESYGPGDFLSLDERPGGRLKSGDERGCVCLITCLDEDGAAGETGENGEPS
jgi:anti-sigma factor ChrR (cupin superfamily)